MVTLQRTIEELLSGLSISSTDPDTSFCQALEQTRFTIFSPLKDLGYFRWKPRGPHTPLSTITSAEQVTQFIDVRGKPEKIVKVNSVSLPRPFLNLQPKEYRNRYPYGRLDIACLYVATKHRNLDITSVDFCFGGSTLELLAQDNAEKLYSVTNIPGTTCLLVVKNDEYTLNLAANGFQFERLVTGRSMSDTSDCSSVEHLQLMKVGPHSVLFRAEVDAFENGSPVEVAASNPRYWGTKKMFQMISSGSTSLCHGRKSRGRIIEINMKPLSKIARDALQYEDCTRLEENILRRMAMIKDKMKDCPQGEAMNIFVTNGTLTLTKARTREGEMLPPSAITREILRTVSPSKREEQKKLLLSKAVAP